MPRRKAMVETQGLDPSGKIVSMMVSDPEAATQSPIASATVPSSVGIATLAEGSLSMEIADDLASGIGVAVNDMVTVRFEFGPFSAPSLDAVDAEDRLTEALGSPIELEGSAVIWSHTFTEDGQSLDLFESNAAICNAFGLYDARDTPDVRFVVLSYSSEVDRTIAVMTDDQRLKLTSSVDTTEDQIVAIIRNSSAKVQLAAVRHHAAPSDLLRRIAKSGPVRPEVNAKGIPTRANTAIQEAARRELSRRNKPSRRASR